MTERAIAVDPRRLGDAVQLANALPDAWLPPTGAASIQIATELRRSHPRDCEALVQEADAILDGRYRLLGFSSLQLGAPPAWTTEPRTRRTAPSGHWSTIPFLDEQIVGDHKVLWEVNRHAHLVTLAQAFLLTGDPRYRERLLNDWIDWCETNPPGRSVNWASALEVAYRAIAWCWVLRLLGPELTWLGESAPLLLGQLRYHGRHVERHYSEYFSPNTHLTGEALALLYLGSVLRGFAEAARWRALGRDILARELERQLLPDGVYFELASWYHRYTVDIYSHAVLLAPEIGRGRNAERLARAVGHLRHLIRPDGRAFTHGDDDGGELLRLSARPVTDFRGSLALGNAVLTRSGTAAAATRDGDEVLPESVPCELKWMGVEPHGSAPRATSASEPGLAVFPDAGLVLVRSGWTSHDSFLAFDAGPHGFLSGGHGHADALSCELVLRGTPLAVDAGTGQYVGPVRQTLRLTSAHNTVALSGRSLAEPRSPFAWARRVDASLDSVTTDEGRLVISGRVPWTLAEFGAEHRRTIVILPSPDGDSWQGIHVLDEVSGPEGVGIEAFWHLAPGLRYAKLDDGRFVFSRDGDRVAELRIDGGHVTSVTSVISPAYGLVEQADVLVVAGVIGAGGRWRLASSWSSPEAADVTARVAGEGWDIGPVAGPDEVWQYRGDRKLVRSHVLIQPNC
jgi:hypothetical protein